VRKNVLIGMEESGTISGAFHDVGIAAYSCDLLPTRGHPEYHYQCDIVDIIPTRQWDLIILHPSCQYLAVCNNRNAATGKPDWRKRRRDIKWTVAVWELAKRHSKRVALENPQSVIFPHLRRAGARVQFIHPWQHGHMEQKKTGLALWNLPDLEETDNVYDDMMALPLSERTRIHYMPPSPTRARDRSITYAGIAGALVNQYGKLL
jgi:hypothetical protein